MLDDKFEYSGDELDIFAMAKNWKSYWSSMIIPSIGDSVLEIGAGIGANTHLLSRNSERWVCVEPDINLCNRIKRDIEAGSLQRVKAVSCTISDLPRDEYYDTILYIDVLEHIKDDVNELLEASSRLKKDGVIIIVSPAHNYLYSPFDAKIGHYRRYNKKMLRNLVPEDLKIAKLIYLDSIGFFASLANKLFLKESEPKASQIKFWDKYLVSASRKIDPVIKFYAGKTILTILKKEW